MQIRPILPTLLLSLLLFQARAQAPYVQQYLATDLSIIPAEIRLSPGYSTIIEFYGAVDLIVTGNPDLLNIDDLGTRIVLTTVQRSGATDLFVEVGGRSLMFEVMIDVDDTSIRRYLVANERERALAPPEAVSPAPPAEAQLRPPSPQDSADTGTGGELTLVPSGFGLDGVYTMFFQYRNATPHRVALDPTRLNVTQNGAPRDFDLKKEPLRNLVSPSETQNGLITVRGVTPDVPLEVTWEVVLLSEDGGQETVVGGAIDAP